VVLDHAAPVGTGKDAAARLRRVDPQVLKQDLIAAGFVPDGESELLHNPADDGTRASSDPTLGGRADRLLLRFKKPGTAVGDQRHADKDLANYYGNTFHLGPSPNLRILYHPDHRYQEYEDKGGRLTSGYWYADADGHFCLYHQTGPALGFVACHPFAASAVDKKPGDRWVEYGASHEPWQVWLEPGIVFPELAAAP
jgi:hypothetical protein